jgi:plasmid stabilization system protein ParE
LADLVGIVRYIREDNPSAAERVRRTIRKGISTLRDFPRMGRPGREPNTRELVFAPLPYVVIYRLNESSIQILRILHGAQRWP